MGHKLDPAESVHVRVELRQDRDVEALATRYVKLGTHALPVDGEVEQWAVGHENATGLERRIPGVRIERTLELDVVALDAGERRPEVREVRTGRRVELEAEIKKRIPVVGTAAPALQNLDEID